MVVSGDYQSQLDSSSRSLTVQNVLAIHPIVETFQSGTKWSTVQVTLNVRAGMLR